MGNKLVSIISPCYNGAKYLPAFLKSVINQTYRPIELLFVNDGSLDDTKAVFESYRDELKISGIIVRYFYQDNGGQAKAINLVLPHFQGEYLMWVDSDDILLPENVLTKVCYLDGNPEIDFVLCEGLVVNSSNIDKPLEVLTRIDTSGFDNKQLFKDLIMEENVIYGPGTIMVRREALIKSIPTLHIYEGRQGQNWQLMLPLAYCCSYRMLNVPLFKYVVHDDSHSHRKRSYKELIERNDVFCELITQTICSIPTISETDKDKYILMTEIKYLKKNIETALYYNKIFKVSKYRRKLRCKSVKSIMYYYPIYLGYRIISKIRRILMKKFNLV